MRNISILFSILFLPGITGIMPSTAQEHKDLVQKIQDNPDFEKVEQKAYDLLKTGFNAGSTYKQVWIRDLNTFIVYSCRVLPREEVRDALLTFFLFQGFDGNVPDGYEEVPEEYELDIYHASARDDMPGYVFHKNTVETDQETSLIQAVYKYIQETDDQSILEESINGMTVLERLGFALEYLMKYRYNKDYGLLWGATTADWGDVQPLHSWGVKYDEYSVAAIDIYDNAMLVIALENYIAMLSDAKEIRQWRRFTEETRNNIRMHIWNPETNKYKPHIYINDWSPFQGIDENEIYYHGGTAVAIQAGLLNKDEIACSLKKMQENVKMSGAQSIGLTLYPVYPEGAFLNPSMVPYGYQNGGDWTWFGARMITALMENGFVKEAYKELLPFIDRVLVNDGFFEWYTIEGKPHGSGAFRGSAGVLLEAMEALEEWVATNPR